MRFLIELFAAMLAAVVVHAVVRRWDEPTDPEAQRERARTRVMRDSDSDDHRCHTCGRVSINRELVMRHNEALLCCAFCAALTKYQERAS